MTSVDSAFSGSVAFLQYGSTNGNHTTLIAAGQTLNTGTLTVGTETDNGANQTVIGNHHRFRRNFGRRWHLGFSRATGQ